MVILPNTRSSDEKIGAPRQFTDAVPSRGFTRVSASGSTSVLMPSVVEVRLVQEVPDGFDFGLHGAAGRGDFFHRAAIAAPRHDNAHRRHGARARTHKQSRALRPESGEDRKSTRLNSSH